MEITLNRLMLTHVASLLSQPKYKYTYRSAEIADYILAELRSIRKSSNVTVWLDNDAALYVADIIRTEIAERNIGTRSSPNISNYLNYLVDLANNIDMQICDLLTYEEVQY